MANHYVQRKKPCDVLREGNFLSYAIHFKIFVWAKNLIVCASKFLAMIESQTNLRHIISSQEHHHF